MTAELDPLYFEKLLIHYIFRDETVREKVLPYLNVDVFDGEDTIDIVKVLVKYIEEYQNFPTKKNLKLMMDSGTFSKLMEIINLEDVDEYDREFVLDQLEEFFRGKLALEAILDAKDGLDSGDEKKLTESPDKLREALSFTFDTNIGLNVVEDGERMFAALHDRDKVVSTGLKTLDQLIEGGFHEKSLSLVLAECVTEDGMVSIRVSKNPNAFIQVVEFGKDGILYVPPQKSSSIREYINCPISDILKYVDGYDVEITSPDGYVPVTHYIKKGEKEIWNVRTDNGNSFECSGKHVVDTNNGLKFVESLLEDDLLLTTTGYSKCSINKTDKILPVVDIRVEHPNHRFFYENVSVKNSNLGKSLIKCALSTNSLLQNKNVLYVSLEMSEEKISERILANAFDIELNMLKMLDKNTFITKLSTMKEQTSGQLYVVAYPPKSINSNRLRNIVKELKTKKKFVPDIIFVDYMGLMSPNSSRKTDNSYSEQKTVSEELRAIAVEFGIPVVSAVQTNRGGFGNSELDMTDIADSIGTVATADVIFGVTQTQEMREAGRYTFLLLKNRYGENKKKCYIGVNYPKMRIYDVEEDSGTSKDIKPDEDATAEIVTSLMKKDRTAGKKKVINFN